MMIGERENILVRLPAGTKEKIKASCKSGQSVNAWICATIAAQLDQSKIRVAVSRDIRCTEPVALYAEDTERRKTPGCLCKAAA